MTTMMMHQLLGMMSMAHELPGLKRVTVPDSEGIYIAPSFDDLQAQTAAIPEALFVDDVPVALPTEPPKKPEKANSKIARQGKPAGLPTPTEVPTTLPTAQPDAGYIVSVQTDLGILEAEAVDIVDDQIHKLFGICYDSRRRGNKIVPRKDSGPMDITVTDKDTNDESIYKVAPIGLSFTIPRSNLLVVLFEQLE
jgi:hypothetical protein